MDINPRPFLNDYSLSLLERKVIVKATKQEGVIRTVQPDGTGAPFNLVVTLLTAPHTAVLALSEVEFQVDA
jgi:hypothetical protein